MTHAEIQPSLVYKQCCGAGAGAGAARSRPFWLEPEPKKLRSFGSGSVIEEDEVKSKL